MSTPSPTADASVVDGLVGIGSELAATSDADAMLQTVLLQARRLLRADAGSLYMIRADGRLGLAVAQNDRLSRKVVERVLCGATLEVSDASVAGFVARTGVAVAVPDARALPPEAPYRVDLSYDRLTGYDTRTVLAVPLHRPGGACLGVLELFNARDDDGGIEPFDHDEIWRVESLAAIAALGIHNLHLQEDLRKAHLDTIIRLAGAAEHRDDDTAAHIRRISKGSAILARQMGLPSDEVELIEYASPMHDIGKIGIPDSILRKPGPLTPEERQAMQQHTLIGAQILDDPQTELIALAREVALCHHERWDGLGYPRGLRGSQIPPAARAVAVVDVFDALLAERCYKPAYPLEKALDIISKDTGKHFAPDAAEALLGSLERVLQAFRVHADEPVRTEAG